MLHRDWQALQVAAYLPILGETTKKPWHWLCWSNLLLLEVSVTKFLQHIAVQLVFILPSGLLGLWWLVPESPRWLIGSGNFEQVIFDQTISINLVQAKVEAQRVAKGNDRELPDHLLKTASISQNMIVEEHPTTTSVLDLFRPRKMLLRTLNMFFQVLPCIQFFQLISWILYLQWFSVTMCYYGLSFASTSLSSGGPYVNFLLR